MKTCTRCKVEKPFDQFGVDRQKSTGLASRCLECHREVCRNYANSEAGRANVEVRRKRFKEANPDKQREYARKWREANPERAAEIKAAYKARNPDLNADYHRRNPEVAMRNSIKRRKKLKGAMGPVDLEALWVDQNGCCGICTEPIDRAVKHPDPMSPSIDHVVPLSLGGPHKQTNLQWAHLACNIRKGARVPSSQGVDSLVRINA